MHDDETDEATGKDHLRARIERVHRLCNGLQDLYDELLTEYLTPEERLAHAARLFRKAPLFVRRTGEALEEGRAEGLFDDIDVDGAALPLWQKLGEAYGTLSTTLERLARLSKDTYLEVQGYAIEQSLHAVGQVRKEGAHPFGPDARQGKRAEAMLKAERYAPDRTGKKKKKKKPGKRRG